ncbi:MAG: VWA domain-containing protein [Acidobacteriota bacterium]
MTTHRLDVPALVATLLALAAPLGLRASVAPSDRPQDAPTFRTTTNILQLDVTVLGKDNRPISNLTAADFVVTEDRTPRSVVAVNWVDVPRPDPARASWVRDVAPDTMSSLAPFGRLLVFVIDDGTTGWNPAVGRDPWILQTGKRIVRDVIDGLGPADLGAVVFTYLGRNQEFTRDHGKLLKAVDSYVPQAGAGNALNVPLGCSFTGRYGCTFETLQHVVDALPSSPPARKLIVFISQGFNLVPDFSNDALARLTPEGLGQPSAPAAAAFYRQLQATNTTIYAFSPGGLQTIGGENEHALRDLAESTGGRAFSGNEPWTGVPAMLEEESGYYVIGVQTDARDGKFHLLHVEVTQPDAVVRARRGYVAPAPAESSRATTQVADLDGAVSGSLPVGGREVVAAAVTFADPVSADGIVRLLALARTDPGVRGPLRVKIAAFDSTWEPRAGQTATIAVPEGAARQLVTTEVRLRPGRYQLRLAAEQNGRLGAVFVDAEIPDFSRNALSTSTLILLPELPGGSSPAASFGAIVRRAELGRTFRRTDAVVPFLEIYQKGRPATVNVDFVIVDDAGRVRVTARETIAPDAFTSAPRWRLSRARVGHPLDLRGLPAGEYLLTAAVTSGPSTSEQKIRLQVQ